MFTITMRQRKESGQAVALPMMILALMVIISVGLLSFEISRTAAARDQLKTATEAAALAGATALSGSTDDQADVSQTNAIECAKAVFRQNEVFGVLMTQAQEGDGTPAAGQALLQFQFIDPISNTVVERGNPKGKAMKVTAHYGLAGQAINIGGSTALEASSTGGAGELDVVLCFDCSGSMREKTFLTSVRRRWNDPQQKIDYLVVGRTNFSLFGGINPQQLSGLNSALRGSQSDHQLPGNFNNPQIDNGFTDVVVNLDENAVFAGMSQDGFDFPNEGALVEAAKGNLENQSVFDASGASTALSGLVTPKAGYQAKYFELARKHTHPWAEAEGSARSFFTLMNSNTRAHFGLVAFNETAGDNPNSSFNQPNVGNGYAPGGNGSFKLPAISLDKADGQTHFEDSSTALGAVVPFGSTNIGAALAKAATMFDGGSRPNARRAIILFTDGIPTVGGPPTGSPIQNCQQAAFQARQKGIAVYSVGLCLTPSDLQEQAQVLNLITNTAGGSSKSFQVQSTSGLDRAFANIARELTQITQ